MKNKSMTNRTHANALEISGGGNSHKTHSVLVFNADGQPTVKRRSNIMTVMEKRKGKADSSPTYIRIAPDSLSVYSRPDSLSLVSRQSDLAYMRSKIARYAAMVVLLLTLGIGQAWADDIDWSHEDYVLCDAGGDSYANKYKVFKAAGQTVASIQNFNGQGWGIYTSFGTNITGVTGVSSRTIVNGGVCLHCSSFTKQETEVTVTCSGGTYTFTVYYEKISLKAKLLPS